LTPQKVGISVFKDLCPHLPQHHPGPFLSSQDHPLDYLDSHPQQLPLLNALIFPFLMPPLLSLSYDTSSASQSVSLSHYQTKPRPLHISYRKSHLPAGYAHLNKLLLSRKSNSPSEYYRTFSM